MFLRAPSPTLLRLFLLCGGLVACGSSGETKDSDSNRDNSHSTSSQVTETENEANNETDSSGSTDSNNPEQPATCEGLFGKPSENTGLSEEQCQALCTCDPESASWQADELDAQKVLAAASWTLKNSPEALTEDPYQNPDAYSEQADALCGVIKSSNNEAEYTLQTYSTSSQLEEAGASLTHYGACGRCSSLQDFAVYASTTDLADPVRECGLEGLTEGQEKNIACLEAIGFSPACAEIWYYNTNHTREECLSVCLAALDGPHHKPDGSLNDCIQCDEDKSGPIFKAVAGRTRRNSGLPSALCRPCDTVKQVRHDYL